MKFSIVEFFENSTLLNIKNLSPAQKMTLKAIMGEKLDTKTSIPIEHSYQDRGFENELEMFKYFSGKDEYEPRFYEEPNLCWGRRSGKSTTIGAGLTIYFATQFDYTPYLGTSPWATIPIISPSTEQAAEVYQAIKNMFLRSPYLYSKYLGGSLSNIEEEYDEDDLRKKRVLTGWQINLTNKVKIKVMAANPAKLRGIAAPFAILDECNFFGSEGNDLKVTDKGIYEALSPALSQFQTVEGMAMILKISSPNGQTGLMYDDYEAKIDEDILHLQIPSWYANPTIAKRYLKKQEKKGVAFFKREYGAEYTASESSYLDPVAIDKMVIKGIQKIDRVQGYRYAAAMDYATKNDYWTFGIGHKEFRALENGENKAFVIMDVLIHWKGSSGSELDPSEIVPQICELLKEYKVPYCISDQYAFAALKPYFQKEGCTLKEFSAATQKKTKYYYSLQVAINSNSILMVSNTTAVKHLKDLREKRTSTGVVRVEAAQGSHDDYADVIALVQYQFDKTSPIYVGTYKEEEDPGPETKDAAGRQVLVPTAQDLAEFVGLSDFHDNRVEQEEEEDGSEDDFWFIM